MSRKDFLRQLEALLRDIPENERREALEYYNNYFEDAGPDREAQIIQELGSPRKVADSIKRDLFGENYEDIKRERQQREDRTTRNVLIAVIVVLTFPLWIGIVGAVFGILVAAVAIVFALALCIVAIVAAFFIAGFVMAGIGLGRIFTGFFADGLVIVAIGMLMLAVSILGLIAIVWAVGKLFPWAVRGVVALCKKPFKKKGVMI